MASKTTLQAVDDPSLAFDPIKVGGDVVLAQHAEVIRALGKRVVHDVIEIGRRLTDAKARCGHGNWLPWLEREFGWSDSTALRYMQAHQFATDKSVTVTDLSLKSLYLLAAPSTPEAARDEVIERSVAGEHLTPAQIKETIDKAVTSHLTKPLQPPSPVPTGLPLSSMLRSRLSCRPCAPRQLSLDLGFGCHLWHFAHVNEVRHCMSRRRPRRCLLVCCNEAGLLDCGHDLLTQVAAEPVPATLAPAAIAGMTLLETAALLG